MSTVQNKTKKLKLAAIDIGSNAIRLALAEYSPLGMKSIKKIRVPIRLGEDTFDKGQISGKKIKISARAFKKFKEIIIKNKIKSIRAVATSALREAKNGPQFVEFIKRQSQIKIEIIDGIEEARLIHLAIKKKVHIENYNALLIDIGGGSLELTFSEKGLPISSHSFPMGTVRTLEKIKKNRLKESSYRKIISDYETPLRHFISSNSQAKSLDFAIGTGGNIETLGRLKIDLLKKKTSHSVSKIELEKILKILLKSSKEERIKKLGLRPDRADVIIPALLVLVAVLKIAKLNKILIPFVGLKEGILWSQI